MVEIVVYHGHLGSGKSVKLAIDAFIGYFTGEIVLANFTLKEPIRYFKISVSALLDMFKAEQKGLKMFNKNKKYRLLLDEAQTEVDAIDFMSSRNKNFGYFVAQLRKRNISLYYATQRRKWTDKRIRDLTDYTVECEALRDSNDDNDNTNLFGCRYTVTDEDKGYIVNEYYLPIEMLQLFYGMYDTRELFYPEDKELVIKQPVTIKGTSKMIEQIKNEKEPAPRLSADY